MTLRWMIPERLVRSRALLVFFLLTGCAHTQDSGSQAEAARAQVTAGYNAYERHDLAKAEQAYREAIRLDPDNVEGYLGLGSVQASQEHDADAQTSFQEAIKRAPKNARAYCGLAVAKSGQGDNDGAIAAFEQAVALDPNNVEARFGLGMSYVAKGERAKALDQARAIEPLSPNLAKQLKAILSPF